MKCIAILAAALGVAMAAAPITFAQVDPPPGSGPQATPMPTPQTPPPVVPEAPPATPPGPQVMDTAPEATPACRTRKDVGEQCSCLSAPTDFGTSAAAESGTHNVCMVPAA